MAPQVLYADDLSTIYQQQASKHACPSQRGLQTDADALLGCACGLLSSCFNLNRAFLISQLQLAA